MAVCMAVNAQETGSTGTGRPSLDDGLLLYYPFDRDDGAIVRDATIGGRTGTVHGASWVADGACGGAYRFDSNAQCILADDAGLPKGDAPRSMALWIKLNVLYPEMTTGLLQYGSFGPGHYNQMSGVGMDWRNGRDQYYFSQYGGVALSQQKMTEPGKWHHLVYTYGGNGSHHLYVDGVPTDGMSELGGPIDTVLSGMLIIGGHPGAVGPNGGFLDEIRIYGRVLSGEEVKELAAAKDLDRSIAAAPRVEPAPPAAPVAQHSSPVATVNEGPNPETYSQNTNAVLEFNKIERSPVAEEAMVLQWASVPGRTYEVHWTDDLTKGFTIIASNLVATATEQSYTNVMGGARAAFYKVKIQE